MEINDNIGFPISNSLWEWINIAKRKKKVTIISIVHESWAYKNYKSKFLVSSPELSHLVLIWPVWSSSTIKINSFKIKGLLPVGVSIPVYVQVIPLIHWLSDWLIALLDNSFHYQGLLPECLSVAVFLQVISLINWLIG